MGILDRLRGKKVKEKVDGAKTFVLVRKGKTGGFEKVMNLSRENELEDIYPSLVPGFYCVHIYAKGQSGFASGPVMEVTGDDDEKTVEGGEKRTPVSGMKKQLQDWKEMRDEFREIGGLFGDLFTEKKTTMEEAMGYFDNLKKYKDTLNSLFPTTTGSKDIPVSGSIPAYLMVIPQIIEASMNGIEQRLIRWGLVDGGTQETPATRGDMIKLPPKPKVEQEESRGEEKKIRPAEEFVVDMPKKPDAKPSGEKEVKTEVIKEKKELGEELEEKEEKENGDGEEEQ